MRAEQNTLRIAFDIERLKIACLGRRTHYALGCLHTEHRVRGNLARNLQRANETEFRA